jgi:hypothetical protein
MRPGADAALKVPRIMGLMFEAEDFANDLGLPTNRRGVRARAGASVLCSSAAEPSPVVSDRNERRSADARADAGERLRDDLLGHSAQVVEVDYRKCRRVGQGDRRRYARIRTS